MKKCLLVFATVIILTTPVWAAPASSNLRILLAGFSNYKTYADVKKGLFKMQGLTVTYDTASPGLQTFVGRFDGDTQTLIDNLRTDLPPGLTFREKILPNQIHEISILP